MDAPVGNYFAALPVHGGRPLLEAVRDGAPQGLRWFHPDDLHLTLAFFGRIIPDRIPALHEVLGQIPFGECAVTLGELQPLPHRRRFSVLAFELRHGRDDLAELIASWRGSLCAAAGVDPDPRPPRPHLSIARLHRRRAHPPGILRWLDQLILPAGAPVRVSAPVLCGWSDQRPARQFRIIAPPDTQDDPPGGQGD